MSRILGLSSLLLLAAMLLVGASAFGGGGTVNPTDEAQSLVRRLSQGASLAAGKALGASRSGEAPAGTGEDLPRLDGETSAAGGAAVARPADPHDATVVCVHGLGGDTWNFALLVDFLRARGFRRIETVKLPGNALSMDVPRFASVLGETIDGLAARGEKNVYLVGHSLGGSVCLEYLRTRKGREPAIPVAVAMASPLRLTSLLGLGAGSLPADTELHCMVMEGDAIVPADAAVVPGARVHRMDPGGISPHMAPVTDRRVMGRLAEILEGR